jgi:hypothetical protein
LDCPTNREVTCNLSCSVQTRVDDTGEKGAEDSVAAHATQSLESSTHTGRSAPWLRIIFSFPALLASVLAVTIFILARNGLTDPDIWWHLRNAEYLFTQHAWPHADIYSFTVIGALRVNHEWLGEVPYYLAWKWFGISGLEAMTVLVLEAVFGLLLYYCWRVSGNVKASAIACVAAIALGTVSFGPRTLLFGNIYLILLLIILERFRTCGRGPLWLLPPLFCLWINTHGSWPVGLLVLGIVAASGLVGGQWGHLESKKWRRGQFAKLVAAGVASVAALFVNPYGYRLVLYPFDLGGGQKLSLAHIQEWMSISFHDARGKVVLVLIAGMLVAALTSRYKWQLHELGILLMGLYFGLTYQRFLFLLGILAAPLVAKLLRAVPPYQPEIDKPIVNAVLMVAALAIIVGWFPSKRELEQSVDARYPAEILPYLQAHPPSHLLNDYLWGGYLIWNARDTKVFIDGRGDVFDHAGVLKDYLDATGLKRTDPVLDRYHIDAVLFPPDEPIITLLRHEPEWKPAFEDKVCVLMERSQPAQAAR